MEDNSKKGDIISIHKHKHLRILELWIADREYNQVFPYLEDRLGRRMIGLNWIDPDGKFTKCGLIVIGDMDLLDETIEICKKGAADES